VTEQSKDSEQTWRELEDAIRNHFNAMWAENGEDTDQTVIVHWAVPIFFREFDEEGVETWGYSLESADGMAKHEIKGLLEEGKDYVDEEYGSGK